MSRPKDPFFGLFPKGTKWLRTRIAPTMSCNSPGAPVTLEVVKRWKGTVDFIIHNPGENEHAYSTLVMSDVPVVFDNEKRRILTLSHDLAKVVCIYRRIQ